VRGMILDLDDTIFPRTQFVFSGFDVVARYVAASWRRERVNVLGTLLHAHASGADRHEFQVLCERHRLPLSLVPTLVTLFRMHTPTLTLDAYVGQALQRLRRGGWRLVILTNGDPGVQRRKVAALGLEPLVDHVVYAEEHAPHGKPDAAAFRAALDRLHVAPSQCVCVGDDPVCDVLGARRLGMRTIQVIKPGIPPDADAAVDSIVEVPSIVDALFAEDSHAA
jgi:putative hydrolase of the HAD superfamily